MITTISKYFGIQSNYPKIVRTIRSDEEGDILADVIFEELMENKVFIKEAKNARKGLIENPNKYPNLTLKYNRFLEK